MNLYHCEIWDIAGLVINDFKSKFESVLNEAETVFYSLIEIYNFVRISVTFPLVLIPMNSMCLDSLFKILSLWYMVNCLLICFRWNREWGWRSNWRLQQAFHSRSRYMLGCNWWVSSSACPQPSRKCSRWNALYRTWNDEVSGRISCSQLRRRWYCCHFLWRTWAADWSDWLVIT